MKICYLIISIIATSTLITTARADEDYNYKPVLLEIKVAKDAAKAEANKALKALSEVKTTVESFKQITGIDDSATEESVIQEMVQISEQTTSNSIFTISIIKSSIDSIVDRFSKSKEEAKDETKIEDINATTSEKDIAANDKILKNITSLTSKASGEMDDLIKRVGKCSTITFKEIERIKGKARMSADYNLDIQYLKHHCK
ncbi:MAG: hypothetical protein LBS66_02010 [Rhodospirillaceae bacterium]|jgi:hypothetical protein|nr:hypothetical protein [Rhodospirillaceae bacterium]